jgi:hypothetical protein
MSALDYELSLYCNLIMCPFCKPALPTLVILLTLLAIQPHIIKSIFPLFDSRHAIYTV